VPAPRLAEDAEVRARLAAVGDGQPRSPYGTRRAAQAHGLPAVDADRLWVNPDCGMKTRGCAETEAALRNLVMAARLARVTVAR
jgi:Cobalamin-independent synthase, Catalytic domain